MSIGETLTEERQRAGLSVTQVSLQTRIRETVIRGMEADDFSTCGGNFYARGHIRSISRVIGIDPEPLVADFDAAHGGAPQPVSAISAFEPEQPVAFRERRSPNWSAAMALALALVVIYGVVQVVGHDGGGERRTAQQVAGTPPPPTPTPGASAPAQQNSPVAEAPRTKVEVRVEAKRTTWLNVRGDKGKSLFSGMLREGDQKDFTAKKKVKLVIGVGGSVNLIVNGKDLGSPGKGKGVQRLSFDRNDPEPA
ncbi:helix-turn-helix domain-containing protein [Actinomadura darangshiensis]|uniref:Helix-turn-helix domain-containing protein n=1 Tax=Actinomadura darangshiensis TaxID=705336 RepID=A0A4V6PEU7_9ACTN|nr:helix-turn-helix domain-containing protein [Actinomadura darangshiensis]TDD81707.1 helix-turn-helix domain-containing protein [Actinomadura darangshiensis]